MSQKLDHITPTYHSFVPNQILTDQELNEVVNYFEDQGRLTRICLSGVGIVCGFKLSLSEDASSITLTQGAGVTTDGDLFHLLLQQSDGSHVLAEQTAFSYASIFDNSDHPYDPQFWNGISPFNTQIPIQELHIDDDGTRTAVSNMALTDLTSKIFVLYLDCYTAESGACTLISCDNQGAQEVRQLRLLMLNESDMEGLNSTDSLFNSSNVVTEYLEQLNCIKVPRVILNELNTDDLANLVNDYSEAINYPNNISSLLDGLSLMLNQAELTDEFDEIQIAFNDIFQSELYNTLFQYRYDLLKDIVDSYEELKEIYLRLYTNCCPDIFAFPKHLLLGKLGTDDLEEGDNIYRHPFYKSPILGSEENEMEKFISLVMRIKNCLLNFIGSSALDSEIRITPSNQWVTLGRRAVPYYYNSILGANLIKLWDFDRRKYNKWENILGYHQQDYSTLPTVNSPLTFDIDPNNFLRIEGHQGLQYANALEIINEQKELYGLPIDVKVLGITVDETADIDTTEYACDFQDLSVLLSAWSSEQYCVLGQVSYILSGFSTSTEGDNVNEDGAISVPPPIATNAVPASNGSGYVDPCSPDASTNPDSPKSNVVIEGLTKEKETLGILVDDVIRSYSGSDSTELAVQIDQKLASQPTGTWSPDMVNATLNLPGKILASSYILTQLIPPSIQQLDNDALISYTNEINKLCAYSKQLQSAYGDSTLIVTRNIKAMIGLLNSQLSAICCSSKKLQALFQEVIDRKNEILQRIKLSNFIQQHPGLEHKAGVAPGGTFVMVYVMKNISEGGQTGSTLPSGTVVADFALPYLCCSDCTPINFIVPKQKVSLSLSTDTFCLGTEDGVFIFDVFPLGGTIEVVDGIPGLSINGTELTVSVSSFDSTNFNIPIHFTVDGQYTDAVLIVRELGVVGFSFTSNVNEYSFTPSGDITNVTFAWDFGDGSPIDTNAFPMHTYDLPIVTPGGEPEVTVTLTVTPNNGACPYTEINVVTLPAVTVSASQGVFCINDSPFEFTITPEVANPIITGIGVTSDGKHFDPALTAGQTGPFPISYAGNVIATMVVTQLPTVSIIPTYETDQLFLTSVNTNTSSYVWSFLDGDTELPFNPPLPDVADADAAILFSSVPDPTSLIVILTGDNECGTTVIRATFTIPAAGS
ncbi:MAG: PKD domain-containing protein [Crocinitomicaceae bacterium]|nr:PKD domain-containing protein [Crocinitomicaceae bacterium]